MPGSITERDRVEDRTVLEELQEKLHAFAGLKPFHWVAQGISGLKKLPLPSHLP
jgi:hypothetical protein